MLRLKVGDQIVVGNGKGMDYYVSITAMDKNNVHTKINSLENNSRESFIRVVLYQGMAKGQKMDFIIQKSVELGITDIIPIVSERTVVKLDTEKEEQKKQQRWQRIAQEACKQCHRGVVPKVHLPMYLKDAAKNVADLDIAIVPYELENTRGIKEVLISRDKIGSIGFFIGPEGGFERGEIDLLSNSGVVPVKLGPRILRTETAAIAVLSVLMYQFGDLGGV